MHSEFVSLAVIAFISAIIPMVAKSIPRRLVPETVLLLLAGSLLGPHGFHIIDSHADSIHMLSEMGCALLFLLAGFEIDPKSVTGEDGRHGLYTWIVTFILAVGAAMAVPIFAQGREGILATALLLTTTALGTLMPILKERGLMGTRIGDLILSYGTWGEVAVVLCVAVLLSTRATWQTAAILGGLFLLCVWIALMGSKSVKDGNALYRFLDSKAGASSQTPVRVTLLLLILLVTFSAVFELDIVLGAFAAGFVLRYIIPTCTGNETGRHGLRFLYSSLLYRIRMHRGSEKSGRHAGISCHLHCCAGAGPLYPDHSFPFPSQEHKKGNLPAQPHIHCSVLHHRIAADCGDYRDCRKAAPDA